MTLEEFNSFFSKIKISPIESSPKIWFENERFDDLPAKSPFLMKEEIKNSYQQQSGIKVEEESLTSNISNKVNELWTQLLNVLNLDPLVLDLDGDGIETVNNNQGITFDFDGDGNRTGTGWIKQDDGILVFDRNGNGLIDNGLELFGDTTLKKDGTYAKNGFDALRDLDTNEDGIFDINDEDFNNVQVWQDLNQDGVAQVNELKSLTELGIQGIVLESTQSNRNDNGNTITHEGSFIWSDGSIGKTASVDLSSNPFYYEYGDEIEPTEETKDLPNMAGSGAVRDLQEAATLDSNLADLLSDYANASTRQEQLAILDHLIVAWAESSDFKDFSQLANETSYSFAYSWQLNGQEPNENQLAQQELFEKLKVLEIFNGRNFYSFEETDNEGYIIIHRGNLAPITIQLTKYNNEYYITEQNLQFNSFQEQTINQAYDSLENSIYQGLILQTRLKDYISAIDFDITENGTVLNYDGLLSNLNTLFIEDPVNAVIDSYELLANIKQADAQLTLKLALFLDNSLNQITDSQLTLLQQQLNDITNFILGTSSDDNLIGTNGYNIIGGGDGDDTIIGTTNNILIGGAGNDSITGSGLIIGGIGNDTINFKTNSSANTLIFNLGDGQDTITSYNGYIKTDKVIFGEGITADMISYRIEGSSLVVVVGDQGDQMTFTNYFYYTYGYGQTFHRFEFADGTVWDDIRQHTFKQYYADDYNTINGTIWNDEIYAGSGNDLITDTSGANYIDGGDGDDTIIGTANNTLIGGAGNDNITGSGIITGGTGNDTINFTTNSSANTLIFNLGDGQDTITTNSNLKTDKIIFGEGITADMITYRIEGSSLVVVVGDQGDQMTFTNYFYYTYGYGQTFHRFEFADGTVWDDIRQTSQFAAIQYTIKGDEEDNTITGDTRNNYLAGLSGNDTLYAMSGNNALEGGKGDDLLVGGTGQDSYFFSLGDGNDTIMTGNDGIDIIKFRDVAYSDLNDLLRVNDDLIISYGDDDSITVDNYFNGGSVATINFIDQSLTENQISNLINAMASFAPESGVNSDLTSLDNDDPNNNGVTLANVV